MKWFIRILVVLVVLILIVLVGGYFYIDRLATRGIEYGATYATGQTTTLGNAHVGLVAGDLSLSKLRIANPEGFESEHFLALGNGDMSVTLGSLLEDTVEVDHLILTDIDLYLEKAGDRANHEPILEHLKRLGSKQAPDKDQEAGKKFIIKEVVLSNITVHLNGYPAVTRPIEIDQIRVANLGSDTDKTVLVSELTGILLRAIFESLLKSVADLPAVLANSLDEVVAGLADLGGAVLEANLKELEGAVDGIADQAQEAVVGALEDAGKAVEDLGKGLEDLLGGKKKDRE